MHFKLVRWMVGASVALSLFGAVGVAQASSLTSQQVSAIVSLLQAFGASPSVIANVQAILSSSSTPTISSNTINSCQNITTPGTYRLSQNLQGSNSVCIYTSTASVTIDCAGYSITSPGTAVELAGNAETLENCKIYSPNTSLYVDGANDIVSDNHFYLSGGVPKWGTGLMTKSSTGTSITDNSFTDTGINTESSSNISISDNSFTVTPAATAACNDILCGYDIGLWKGGSNNLIQNNTLDAGQGDDNINLQDQSYVTVDHNIIQNSSDVGIEGVGMLDHATITNNTITDQKFSAIGGWYDDSVRYNTFKMTNSSIKNNTYTNVKNWYQFANENNPSIFTANDDTTVQTNLPSNQFSGNSDTTSVSVTPTPCSGASCTAVNPTPSTATATIDTSSLTTTSPTPTITGSATNTTGININISNSSGQTVWYNPTFPVPVSNNRWSVSIPATLQPGTYTVYINSSTGSSLTNATLTVQASAITAPPTATINPSSLTATSLTPTITGTAANTNSVTVTVSNSVSNLVYTTLTAPVTNGSWSVTLTQSYTARPKISVSASGTVLTTGTLISDCGSLAPGASLSPGQSITSCNGQYTLYLQNDGNVVLYEGSKALWATNTAGKTASTFTMQTDGNLVLYGPNNTFLWGSAQSGGSLGSPAYFAVQNDSNLVVYSTTNAVLWNSGVTNANGAAAIMAFPGFSAAPATSAAPVTSVYAFMQTLSLGSSGPDVTALQQLFVKLGLLQSNNVTGYFGPLTQVAVETYQAAHLLPQDGVVGPLTRQALNSSEQ